MNRSESLELLPPCATTGIGSLPFSLDEALQVSMQQDAPYLPELVRGGAEHFMVPQALSGELPAQMGAFCTALRRTAPRFAKAQVAGPATAGQPEHLAVKAAKITGEMVKTGVTPIVFIDEPALGLGALPIDALELVRTAASEAGAIVGLHCCGQTRWAELLAMEFEIISLDVRLSLEALLEDRRAWLRFLERGGTLCLGIIPTNPGARYDVAELCDSVEAALRATTPDFERVLSRMLLSPACGLGLHPPAEAKRISADVRTAQLVLRALL